MGGFYPINGLGGGGGGGSSSWKAPVPNIGALPPTGNTIGDVRLVTSTNELFQWNGVSWVLLNGSSGGTVTASYVQTFIVGDWILQGDGTYTITILSSAHNKIAPLWVDVEELVGNVIPGGSANDYELVDVDTDIDPTNLTVQLRVPTAADRFIGRVLVSGGN